MRKEKDFVFNHEKRNEKNQSLEENAKKKVLNEEESLYLIGWILIACLVLYVLVTKSLLGRELYFPLPCLFHLITGGYCPGCGGTRAVVAITHGKILSSFCYHPIVLYTLVVGGWFMVSQTLERITHKKIGMTYRSIYVFLAIGLIIINCLIKNLWLFAFGVDLLKI